MFLWKTTFVVDSVNLPGFVDFSMAVVVDFKKVSVAVDRTDI